MSFGKMNTFIDIMEKVSNKDSAGFNAPSYNIAASVRAYKEERHGNERWANMAAFTTATALFRFRVIPKLKITTEYLIKEISDGNFLSDDGENIYNIVSVEDVRGRGMYIEALAEKIEGSVG